MGSEEGHSGAEMRSLQAHPIKPYSVTSVRGFVVGDRYQTSVGSKKGEPEHGLT